MVEKLKPHFFRPLIPGFQHQLTVPLPFYLKHLKEKNPEKAVLRSPSGKLWHVKMNGRLFEDGWEEFCEDHDLHVGDFLVFRHDDDDDCGLMFDVLVFDSSTCQRDYPSNFTVKEEITETPEEEEIPKASAEKEIIETPQQEEIPKESAAGQLTKKKKKGMTKFQGKAGSSVSQYRHFVLTLSSYAANCAALNIPREFGRVNGLDNRCCKVVLLNEQGKVWMASLGFKRCDGQAYIKQSWSAFRRANSIKAGDSCIFELIRDGEKPVLKITKLKLNPKPEEQPTNNVARPGCRSRNPRVHITVHESYTKLSHLRIPIKFAKKSGLTRECQEEMTIRNEKGKSWTVSLLKSKSGGVRIGLGWITFARSNGIKTGDVLMLELIKRGKKPVMRISGAKQGMESKKKSSGAPEGVHADA